MLNHVEEEGDHERTQSAALPLHNSTREDTTQGCGGWVNQMHAMLCLFALNRKQNERIPITRAPSKLWFVRSEPSNGAQLRFVRSERGSALVRS